MTDGVVEVGAGGSAERLVLGIDTCGPSGSVALARILGNRVELLGQIELAGRSYSATLVTAVGEILNRAGVKLHKIATIAAVSGPGSFTGVRVGLSAVKGLAEPSGIPVAVVSRLAVLAYKAGLDSAVLDAHRHEVFLRVSGAGARVREVLAGQAELAAINPQPAEIAVCDDEAAALLSEVWPATRLVRVEAPNAANAIELAKPKILACEFVDLALLDGHYLRRSDAEIFGPVRGGEAAAAGRTRA